MKQKNHKNIGFFISLLLYFPLIAQTTSNSNPSVQTLTREKFQLIIQKIKYLNSAERIYTIKSLEKLSKEDKKKFFPLLAEISISDFDPLVKEAALKFLSNHHAECSLCIKAYKNNLFDKEEKVQLQALKGIENLKRKDCKEEFVKLLNQLNFKENGIFLNALLRVLGKLKYDQEEITRILIKKFKDPETESEVKRTIILYAGNSQNQNFKDILYEQIKQEEDLYLRAYAINSLGKLSGNFSTKEKNKLKKMLKTIFSEITSIPNPKERTKYNPIKQQIILALIRLGDSSVKEEIKKSALDDDPNVRKRAIQYIGELNLKEYQELIETKYQYDPSKSVRKEAEKVLKKWSVWKKKKNSNNE